MRGGFANGNVARGDSKEDEIGSLRRGDWVSAAWSGGSGRREVRIELSGGDVTRAEIKLPREDGFLAGV
jgi:hypothetical protein